MCGNWNPTEKRAAVVCRELGYKGAVATSRRPRNTNIHKHLLWFDLYCSANEDSIFECNNCCTLFYQPKRFPCKYLPVYACQSKSGYELHS